MVKRGSEDLKKLVALGQYLVSGLYFSVTPGAFLPPELNDSIASPKDTGTKDIARHATIPCRLPESTESKCRAAKVGGGGYETRP